MLPLFVKQLHGTLNRGADPVASHALALPPRFARHTAHVCASRVPTRPVCLRRRCRALPLFTEELDGTLNRGADPESGHALDLHRARFRLAPAALAADGDWCYKDSRVPQGETLLNAIRLWWQWCLSPMQLCSAGRRWRHRAQDGRALGGREASSLRSPLLVAMVLSFLHLQRACRRRLQLQRRGDRPPGEVSSLDRIESDDGNDVRL